VRDFALKIEDEVGNKLTSKGYLEKSLKELGGTSDKIEEKNKIRRKIVSMFQDRDCFTLVRPTEEEKDLQKLQTIDDEKLRPEFFDAMVKLRERVY